MTNHQVVIAGAGSTGLMLAGELRLQGIDALVVEPRLNQDIVGHRALGFQSRMIEVLDQRGIADRFLAAGQTAQTTGFADVRFDLSAFPTRHPYGLGLRQVFIERLLLGWVEELGAPVRRGVSITGFTEGTNGIDVALSDGSTLRTQYLVGCDGGRSIVRKTAGIGFPGSDPTISHLLAEAEFTAEAPMGMGTSAAGLHALSIINGKVAIMVTERELDRDDDPDMDDLRDGLIAHFGTDFGVHNPSWITRFTDMTRHAETYRKGRVLVAGDAAHIHYPAGGQGLTTGVQDVVNLGWKLAQVVKGISPDALLDTYHAERHPVAARVLRYTMASVALARTDDRSKALRAVVNEIVAMDEPRRTISGMMSGLDIHYDLGEGHPLLGRRMPDLELATEDGPVRVFTLLHPAVPLLIDLDQSGSIDITGWADRVQRVDATYEGTWELPVIGTVTAPNAVLVRPDGYVAWVCDERRTGLSEALQRWFGEPRDA
jgi:3-(3-hydroxy-phenyl)propionate hydroxylase